MAEGPDALKVNGCEVTVTDPDGKVLYLNAWITDWPITEHHVAALATSGRARWKIENENNNTLKTKGYPCACPRKPSWHIGHASFALSARASLMISTMSQKRA